MRNAGGAISDSGGSAQQSVSQNTSAHTLDDIPPATTTNGGVCDHSGDENSESKGPGTLDHNNTDENAAIPAVLAVKEYVDNTGGVSRYCHTNQLSLIFVTMAIPIKTVKFDGLENVPIEETKQVLKNNLSVC